MIALVIVLTLSVTSINASDSVSVGDSASVSVSDSVSDSVCDIDRFISCFSWD